MEENNRVLCDCCGEQAPATQQSTTPDGGWTLPIDLFGGYGLFDDDIAVAIGGKKTRWLSMCHDCVVKFLTAFPLLGKAVGGGCHPNNIHRDDFIETDRKDGTLDPACCQWAWCWKELGDKQYETYYGTADGGWVLAHTSSDEQDSLLNEERN